jgi:hypothetical protein
MTVVLRRNDLLRASIFVLILILFAAVFTSVQAASKICQYCKKPVQTTQFLLVEGNYYCANHFRCANCDKSIGEDGYFKESGKYYDYACYFQLFGPKCAVCGKTIDGKYITFEGKNYHDECYNRSVALRCGVCGDMINGEYLTDFWGNNYHARHQGETPECDYCGRFISSVSDGGNKFTDGRTVCGICSKSAITTLAEMDTLVTEVRRMLLTKGIDVPFEEADNHLVGRDELLKLIKRTEPDIQGYAAFKETRVFGLFSADQRAEIYLLHGMPIMKAMAVLAHELMHLWQFRYAKRNADLDVQEGSANYAAWLILQDFSDDEAKYILHNLEKDPNPAYGEGFRRIRKFAQAQNRESFLEYLKKNKKMPAGY